MARRLVALLVIACACAAGAVAVSSARAGKDGVRTAHIPAIPAAAPIGDRCPIPPHMRPAFEDAASETDLPLALLTAVARVERGAAGGKDNVLAGARYLETLFTRFSSSNLALAAYDAGAATREETLTYVADVTSVWRSLAGCR